MTKEIKIPDIGENVESGEIIKVLVKEGDLVEVDQPLLELETEKAVVEIPSPEKGKIIEIAVKSGGNVKIGQIVARIETEAEEPEPERGASREKEEAAAPAETEVQETVERETAAEEAGGPDEQKEEKTETKERKGKKEKDEEEGDREPEEPAGEAEEPVTGEAVSPGPREMVAASPSVRRLARELGIDINEVRGSGPGGRVSPEDVKAHVRRIVRGAREPRPAGAPQLPDFRQWGPIHREALSQVRRTIARNTAAAWNLVPHVTQFDAADITELERFRKEHGEEAQAAGGKLTVTAILLGILARGLKRFPRFNASLDVENDEIIYKDCVHIGVAVDTPRGLLVPVVRDVDTKSILQLSVELTKIAERARQGKVAPDELRGGTFTISNQGGIGGTNFTPVVFWPQAAILGVSRASMTPVYAGGKPRARLLLPLSLSYDHRLNDGADAARFLRWVAQALEQPLLAYYGDGNPVEE